MEDMPFATRCTGTCFTSALPRSARVELHRKVAGALERERAETRKVSAAELAFHFEQGGELDTALGYYAEAADSALLHFSPAETMNLTEHALSLLLSLEATSARTSLEITLATLQGAAAVQSLGLCSTEAKRAYQRAWSLLDQEPQHPLRGLLLNGLGVVLWMRGELEEANVVAQRSEALADKTGDPTTWLCACLLHGIVRTRAWAAANRARLAREGHRGGREPRQDRAAGRLSPPTRRLSFSACSRSSWRTSASWTRRARARAWRTPAPALFARRARNTVRCGSTRGWRCAWATRNASPICPRSCVALIDEYALMPDAGPCISGSAAGRRRGSGTRAAAIACIREGYEQAVRFGLRGLASEARTPMAPKRSRVAGDWVAARRELDGSDAVRRRDRRAAVSDAIAAARCPDRGWARRTATGRANRFGRPLPKRASQEAPWLELAALSARCERPDVSAKDFAALAHVVELLAEGIDTAPVARARELLKRRRGASTSARR